MDPDTVGDVTTELIPTQALLDFTISSPTSIDPGVAPSSTNTIHPDAQLVPAPPQVVALAARHSVTRVARRTASERAMLIAETNSCNVASILERTINWVMVGIAIAVRIASTATVTINSMSVKPWLECQNWPRCRDISRDFERFLMRKFSPPRPRRHGLSDKRRQHGDSRRINSSNP